jgi:hypothetical protein
MPGSQLIRKTCTKSEENRKKNYVPMSMYLRTSTDWKFHVIEMMGVFKLNFWIRLVAEKPGEAGTHAHTNKRKKYQNTKKTGHV